MGKRLAMIVTLLALALLAAPGAKAEGVKRALVMGFDTFQSQPSTTPSSANNVTLMANALSGGSMNLYQLVTHLDDLATTEAFAQAVQEAFDGATDEDINYFYISTHGVWQEGMSMAHCSSCSPTAPMRAALLRGKCGAFSMPFPAPRYC